MASQDEPRIAWYSFAPVAWAGRPRDPASAPRAIDFSIAARPGSAYRLKASLLIEHSSVPALGVRTNGRLGTFYLHPRLDYNMGDMVAAFYPAYGRAEVEVDFPGSWLKTGTNSISFQAVPAGDKIIPDAGLEYDAIELQQVDPVPTAVSAYAEPRCRGLRLRLRAKLNLPFDTVFIAHHKFRIGSLEVFSNECIHVCKR